MTKEEFIREAKKRGMDKESTFRKFKQLEAAGDFSDIVPEAAPEEKEDTINIGGIEMPRSEVEAQAKESFVGKTQDFVGGAFKEPIATAGGLATGVAEGIGKFGARTLGKVPGMGGERLGIPEKPQVDIPRDFEKPSEPRPMTPEAKEQFERSKPVGEFGVKAVAGGVASTLAPGSGVLATLGQGALANVPFIPQAFEEGGVEGAIKDIALNTAIDLATLGASKAIPGIKQAILKKFGKDVTEEVAENMAKEAFQQVSAKEVKSSVEKGFKIGEQEFLPSAAPKKTLGEKVFGRIKEGDRSILSEPLKAGDTPFTNYAKVAQSVSDNPQNIPALDYAYNTKGVEAMDKLAQLKKNLGTKVKEVLGTAKSETVDASDLLSMFNKKTKEVLGIGITEVGKKGKKRGIIKGVSKAPGQNELVEKSYKILKGLGDSPTVEQLNIAKSALGSFIADAKGNAVKPNVAMAEAIVMNAKGHIDDMLETRLGKGYKEVSKEYGELKDLISFFNKKLGQVVDPKSGAVERGASLFKTAVQSNSDKGMKATFKRVKELTGVDLFKEAKYAEIATRAVGDARGMSLIEKAGSTGGKIGLLKKIGDKAIDIKRGSELDELINFYNKAQGGQ